MFPSFAIDHGQALRDANDYLVSIGGGTIDLRGRYTANALGTRSVKWLSSTADPYTDIDVTAALFVDARVSLRARKEARILRPSGSTTAVVCLVDYSEGVIEGFEIQGPDPANNVMHGLLRTVTDPNHIIERVKIRDLHIHDVGSYCIGQQFGGLRDVIVENNVIEDTGADGIDWKVRTGKPANIENNCWGVKILGNTIRRPANRLSSDVSGIGLRGQAILEGNHVYELPAGCYGIELVPGIGTVADWRQSANRTICSDWYVEAADPTSDTVGLLAWASGGITIGPGYAKGCRVQSLAPSMTPYDFRNGPSFTGVIVDGVRGREAPKPRGWSNVASDKVRYR